MSSRNISLLEQSLCPQLTSQVVVKRWCTDVTCDNMVLMLDLDELVQKTNMFVKQHGICFIYFHQTYRSLFSLRGCV